LNLPFFLVSSVQFESSASFLNLREIDKGTDDRQLLVPVYFYRISQPTALTRSFISFSLAALLMPQPGLSVTAQHMRRT
jgi:hypothetical protein